MSTHFFAGQFYFFFLFVHAHILRFSRYNSYYADHICLKQNIIGLNLLQMECMCKITPEKVAAQLPPILVLTYT